MAKYLRTFLPIGGINPSVVCRAVWRVAWLYSLDQPKVHGRSSLSANLHLSSSMFNGRKKKPFLLVKHPNSTVVRKCLDHFRFHSLAIGGLRKNVERGG